MNPLRAGVSAVAFYLFRWNEEGPPAHDLRVYHNPYAKLPLSTTVLAGYPQLIAIEDEPGRGHMEWTPSDPQET